MDPSGSTFDVSGQTIASAVFDTLVVVDEMVDTGPSVEAIGTGPLEYDSYEPGVAYTVTRNENYWNGDLPYLDGIRFEFLPDALERASKLTRGDIDMLHGYNPSILDAARSGAEAGTLKVVENGTGEEDVIAINTETAPFDDVTARQALAYATDAAAWRAVAEADGGGPEVRGPFVAGQLGFSEDDAFPAYDVAKATQLVDEYEAKTSQPMTVELVTTDLIIDQQLAEILVGQWAEAGIEATVRSEPLSPLVSTNVSRYADETIDTALDEARATADPDVRDASYQVVAKQLNTGVAQVGLGRPTWVLAANPQVRGLPAGQVAMATLGAKPWLATLWLS